MPSVAPATLVPVIITLAFALPTGMVAGAILSPPPDKLGGPSIVSALTEPHLIQEKNATGQWIKRPRTREEIERFCSNLCAFGWYPNGRGGTAIPQ